MEPAHVVPADGDGWAEAIGWEGQGEVEVAVEEGAS